MYFNNVDIPQLGRTQTSKYQNLVQYTLPRGDNDDIQVSQLELKGDSFMSQSFNAQNQSAVMNDYDNDYFSHIKNEKSESNKQGQETAANSFTFKQIGNISKSISVESERQNNIGGGSQHHLQRNSIFKQPQLSSIINHQPDHSNKPKSNETIRIKVVDYSDNNSALLLQSVADQRTEEGRDQFSLKNSSKVHKTSTFVQNINDQDTHQESNKSVNKAFQDYSITDQQEQGSFLLQSLQVKKRCAGSVTLSPFDKSHKSSFATMVLEKNILVPEIPSKANHKRVELYIRKFVHLLKNSMISRSAEKLTLNQRQMINDQADFNTTPYKFYNIYFLEFLLYKLSKLFNNSSSNFIAKPTDTFLIIWDTVQIIFNFVFLYAYSIFMVFDETEPHLEILDTFFSIFTIFCILDIFLNFNTSFYMKDQIIIKRKDICVHYFKEYFVLDLISSVASLYVTLNNQNSVVYNPHHKIEIYLINIVIFFRIFGVFSKRKVLDSIYSLSDSQRHLIKLFNQLIFMITIAHIMGIFWYSLGLYQKLHGQQIVWYTKYEQEPTSSFALYIFSFYWAVTTMTTVGYGDITPTNPYECLFCAISMIIFSCVFAYSINNIGIILDQIEQSTKQMNDKMIIMQRYLIRRNVNSQLRNRVKQYLYFLGQETKKKNIKAEEQVIGILSNKLRNELSQEVNTKMLKTCSIFYNLFSQTTINRLVGIMKEIQVAPNEVIFNSGEVGQQSLYFILDGEIELYCEHEKRKTVQKLLSVNEYFGENAFFSGFSRNYSARSINLSTLFYIPREEFLSIVRLNSEDFQRYRMIQEQLCLNLSQKGVNIKACVSCGSLQHNSIQCGATHLSLDKQFIILKNNYYEFQMRNPISKRSRKKSDLISLPFKNLQNNDELSKNLKEKIAYLGGEFYERIKMYSLEDNDSNNESENILQEDFQTSESNCSTQIQSVQDLIKNIENQQALHNSDTSSRKGKICFKQDKSNNVQGSKNGTLLQLPQQQHSLFLQDTGGIESEHTKLTIKTQDHYNSVEDQEMSLKEIEKKCLEDQIQAAHLINEENNIESVKSIMNDIKKSEKSQKVFNEMDLNSISKQQINSGQQIHQQQSQQLQMFQQQIEESKQKEIKPTKQHFIKKCTKDINTGEFEGTKSIKSNIIKSSKEIMNSLQSESLKNLDQLNKAFQESSGGAEFPEISKYISRRNQISKKKTGGDEDTKVEKSEKGKNQPSIKKLISKLCTSNSILEDANELKKQSTILEKINSERSDSTIDDRRKGFQSNTFKTVLQSLIESNHISDKTLVDIVLLDLLTKKTNIESHKLLGNNYIDFESFDKMKNFSCFFIHNNVDQVLLQIRSKKIQSKFIQKVGQRTNQRRPNVYQNDLESIQEEIQKIQQDKSSSMYESNHKSYNPTYLSYGINTKRSLKYPIRYNHKKEN